MADDYIKTVSLKPMTLPVLSQDGNYYVRYRIVSEDKTATSTWSPIIGLTANSVSSIVGSSITNTYQSDGTNVFLTWNIPTALANASFDVFVKWNTVNSGWTSLSWTYLTTTQSNNFHTSIPSTYVFSYTGSTPNEKYAMFMVQVATANKTALASANLFTTAVKSTKPTVTDGGGPSTS